MDVEPSPTKTQKLQLNSTTNNKEPEEEQNFYDPSNLITLPQTLQQACLEIRESNKVNFNTTSEIMPTCGNGAADQDDFRDCSDSSNLYSQTSLLPGSQTQPDYKLKTPPHLNSTGSQTPQTPLDHTLHNHKLHCIHKLHKLHYTPGSQTPWLPKPPFTANQVLTVNTTDCRLPKPPLKPPPNLTLNQGAIKIAADAPQTSTTEEEETNEHLKKHEDFAVN